MMLGDVGLTTFAIGVACTLLVILGRQRSYDRARSNIKVETRSEISKQKPSSKRPSSNHEALVPIGVVRSVFANKRGVPRQGLLAPSTQARIELDQAIISGDSLDGLEEFSHVWIVFLFDRNTNTKSLEKWRGKENNLFKSKIRPPVLGGRKIGIFATRTPHRPNPVGMTLALIKDIDISNSIITVEGVDLCDMTPVIDLKPYIPSDRPEKEFHYPEWLTVASDLRYSVTFSPVAETSLSSGLQGQKFYKEGTSLRRSVIDVLCLDVRGKGQARGSANPELTHKVVIDGVAVTFVFKGQEEIYVHNLTVET